MLAKTPAKRRTGRRPRTWIAWRTCSVAGAGLDPADQQRGLDEGRYEALLDRYREEATSMGINAIPAHIVGQRYLLLGAQPYEAFIEVLDKLQAGAHALRHRQSGTMRARVPKVPIRDREAGRTIRS